MTLEPLTLQGALAMLPQRHANMAALRTAHRLTEAQQIAWYNRVLGSETERWWEIPAFLPEGPKMSPRQYLGYCGIEHIDWIARTGELSLLCDIEHFMDAFDELINEGFTNLALRELHAEVYHCSPFHALWREAGNRYNAQVATLLMRKWWRGQYYDADWISIRVPV